MEKMSEMHKSANLTKTYNDPAGIKQPELVTIIDRLRSLVNRYDDIVCETKCKLQVIKVCNEPSMVNSDVSGKQPESLTEEISSLLSIFSSLNEKAESNLRHLKEIG